MSIGSGVGEVRRAHRVRSNQLIGDFEYNPPSNYGLAYLDRRVGLSTLVEIPPKRVKILKRFRNARRPARIFQHRTFVLRPPGLRTWSVDENLFGAHFPYTASYTCIRNS